MLQTPRGIGSRRTAVCSVVAALWWSLNLRGARLGTDWNSSGKRLSIADAERDIGYRLRLHCRQGKCTQTGVEELAVELLEGPPPVALSSQRLLLEWYAKHHPASGASRPATAEDLEACVGDELQQHYSGMRDRARLLVLSWRRSPVLVS